MIEKKDPEVASKVIKKKKRRVTFSEGKIMNAYLYFLNYALHKLSCTHLRAHYQIQLDKLLQKLREHAR